jgi:hypothetical protein
MKRKQYMCRRRGYYQKQDNESDAAGTNSNGPNLFPPGIAIVAGNGEIPYLLFLAKTQAIVY